MINKAKLNASKNDECYTPAEGVVPLIKHLPYWVKTVWCPCDTADSQIVKALTNSGYKVFATHISTGEDFFSKDVEFYADRADMIITNPPYSCKDKIIERCITLCRPWALLLPLDALCGKQRFKLYKKAHWVPSVITIASRVDFTGKNRPWFNVVWIVSSPGFEERWIQEDC